MRDSAGGIADTPDSVRRRDAILPRMFTRAQITALQKSRRHGIGRLLLLARQDFIARLSEKMNGPDNAALQARGRLLPYIDVDGTRSIDLARRLGVTKQAVARMVKDLEDEGLLCRDADGADGRASLVRFTEAGLEYMTHMHKCIAQIEREYARLIGNEQMTVVRDALSMIAYRGEPADSKGADRA
ncbi:MarR family winged helix-turn-helix transcriptional regulator [Variovorax sp. SRS16]|uniref:MarR family winged helix-turn-helix transcriptional regulator n=1 Tax=Variovorax sp. SRS16 TaxID=282217 RepID=UPI0013A5B722|nr:MarR family transcriptional regulator [Variovorax sp. SRS16]